MSRRVLIMGASGSIGRQALDVVDTAEWPDGRPEIVGLGVGTDTDFLAREAHNRGIAHTACAGDDIGALIDACTPDLVLNGVVGFAGLSTTLAALERGVDVALANKESLVAGGALCTAAAEQFGAQIIPVDSEHSALQQCLGGSPPTSVASLVLTASGGPFYGKSLDELRHVTVDEALAHPTWSMGGKISIDSATLMNKGLELIEAMVLFDLSAEKIEVVVHRDSIVHALVRHHDESLIAHLGWPDMRVPIAWAIGWPTRPAVAARHLDLTIMPALEFAAPDTETFRCLQLARDSAVAGGSSPLALNAANEIAVEGFLRGDVGFCEIPTVVEGVLDGWQHDDTPQSLEHAMLLDAQARAAAHAIIDRGLVGQAPDAAGARTIR